MKYENAFKTSRAIMAGGLTATPKENAELKLSLAALNRRVTPNHDTAKLADGEAAKQRRAEERAAARSEHAEFMAKQAAIQPEKDRAREDWAAKEKVRLREKSRITKQKWRSANREKTNAAHARYKLKLKSKKQVQHEGKGQETLALIDASKEILEEIQPASVRAVCYRLFTRRLIPDMSKNSTGKVSVQLVYAREEGIIPWEHVVDENRKVERTQCWDDASTFFDKVLAGYAKDPWLDQPQRVEVWSEKGTVRGTLATVLDEFKVPFRVFHGFNSATGVWDAAQDTKTYDEPILAIYVGDFDPSGLHMSEVDLPERLERYGGTVTLLRAAVTEDDVRNDRTLPDFPASDKTKDPRHRWFTENHGQRCVELDAMPPPDLRARVRKAILAHIDGEAWEQSLEIEQEERVEIDEWKARIMEER